LEVSELIGSLELDIDPNLSGPTVMDLLHDSKKASVAAHPAYFTVDAFPLHTDLSYVRNPPKFLLIHCVTPAPAGEGATLLADCSRAYGDLSEDSRSKLSQPLFLFRHPPGCPAGEQDQLAVHCVQDASEFWRFRPDIMEPRSDANGAVDEFSSALQSMVVSIWLLRGDMLIVDNHRLAHGRTAFRPAQDLERRRHLRRCYAQART
jgi:alpha-ketoglutarate-dependent taurine dioxygenase